VALGRVLRALLTLVAALSQSVLAATYANVTVPFNWIDASGHTKVGYNTTPYKFNGGGGCGTNPPTLDDTISDNIPIGFTFMFGGVNFTHVRIMTNGRLQFNNNTTCGYGSPVTQLPYPNANLNYTMRIYGNDLDPTLKSDVPAYPTVCLNNASCYISYATIGTAPYRSFVVTWNNIPEWASGGSTSGNYNLQVILQENGEFIYQYGMNTPGPQANVAQVGWQVDTNDYDVVAVGLPANNTAIKFYIPQPVAEYRMEQPSWNGTAGEVLDTSGNGRHATAIQAGGGVRPQDVATGKVCRGGQIAHNTTKSDISAIATPVAIPTMVGNAGTITFWYNNSANTPNLTRMLFDATTTGNKYFDLQRLNNGALSFRIRDSGGAIRSVTTAGGVLPNTGWSHIAVSWNFNNLAAPNSDRLRIWVNGVLRQTSTFTTNAGVSNQIGTLYIGDNRSNNSDIGVSAGSPGGTTATLDEFRIYNYEGGLALVQRDMNQAGACLNHYAISHAGSGQACQSNHVTVTAHDAAHGLVIMPNNTTQITLSTSTGQGDWALVNGYGVLNNGTANDGIATYLWNGEYQAVFALTHPTPGTVNFNVTDGQIVEQEDPNLVLASCVTVSGFNACHDYATSQCKATGRLYTRLAGAAFTTDVVALDSGGNVDTTFTGKAVVSLIARAISGGVDANNCFVPEWTSTLDNATTAFTAGKLTVSATAANAWREARIKVVCDSTNCPPAGVTACSVDNFAIRPQAFTVTSTNANADATGTSSIAIPVIKAGDSFSLTATAIPGYNGIPKIDNTKVEAHSGAVATGALSGTFGAANVLTGSATSAAFSYSEVGYFRLKENGVFDDVFTSVDQPNDCTNDFSNTVVGGKFGCKFGNTAVTGYFGRFIPHHFDTTVTPACSSFTYSGQPFPLTVTAKNASGDTTANYSGGFAKTVTLTDANGAAGTFNPSTLASGEFANGVADKTSPPTVSFTFPNNLTAPATLKIRASDGEASSADGTEGTTPLRSGRLVLSNAHGSEYAALTMPFQTQYWTGSAWATNTLDSCTDITASLVFVKNPAGMPTPTGGAVSAGKGTLNFTAPNQKGSVEVCANIGADGDNPITSCRTGSAYPWLQGSWDGDGQYNDNPAARATFGIFKGRDPVIYRRERY